MAYPLLGRPFFLKLSSAILYSLFLLLTIIHAEDQPLKAWLTANQQRLQLTLNSSEASRLGAWIFFLDCGFENGNKDGLGGLDNVDFKIENGDLYRFLRDEAEPWRKEGTIEKEIKANFLLSHIPTPSFIQDDHVLRWRCVTFPHNQTSPHFLPISGPGRLPATDISPLSSEHNAKGLQKSMNIAIITVPADENLPWQTVDERTLWKTSPTRPHLFEYLNDPFKESLWWPTHTGSLTELCQLERSTASKFSPKQQRPIVFTSIQHENLELIKWMNDVRLWSCNDNQLACAFIVKSPHELPAGASTAILPWASPIDQSFEVIKENRAQLPMRSFVFMDHFFDMSPEEQKASWLAWMKLKLTPLVPPDIDIPSLGHELIAELIWFKILLQHNKRWRPLPVPIHQKHFKRALRFSPDAYLSLITEELLHHLPQS